jgi:hypothetical protein
MKTRTSTLDVFEREKYDEFAVGSSNLDAGLVCLVSMLYGNERRARLSQVHRVGVA